MREDNNDNDNVFGGGNQNQPGGLRRAHLQGRNLNEDVSLNEEDLLDLEGLAQFDASSNLLDQPNNLMTKASGASVIPQAHRPLRDNTFDITNGNTVDNFLLSNPTRQMQMAQQFKPQPQMDGEAQAVLQASMAETKRRADRDQADIKLKAAQMQQDMAEQDKKQQFEAAQNTEKLLTEERLKTLDLTVDAARLKKEQGESAIALQNELQRNLNKGV